MRNLPRCLNDPPSEKHGYFSVFLQRISEIAQIRDQMIEVLTGKKKHDCSGSRYKSYRSSRHGEEAFRSIQAVSVGSGVMPPPNLN